MAEDPKPVLRCEPAVDASVVAPSRMANSADLFRLSFVMRDHRFIGVYVSNGSNILFSKLTFIDSPPPDLDLDLETSIQDYANELYSFQ